ncbi:hypothetical protein B0H16DRAFT_1454167 [Mycena metata]|uniref:Uncharacterized protein n=1 Tax=Mycena metata TaxID=1033252 RepID=A0AAD7JIJ3_9AGAR|nr:hypothetical protein B0H16DRAFT_1454167 [Mycena metata]
MSCDILRFLKSTESAILHLPLDPLTALTATPTIFYTGYTGTTTLPPMRTYPPGEYSQDYSQPSSQASGSQSYVCLCGRVDGNGMTGIGQGCADSLPSVKWARQSRPAVRSVPQYMASGSSLRMSLEEKIGAEEASAVIGEDDSN